MLPSRFRGRLGELQIPPLRFAPVGMTKGSVVLPSRFQGRLGD
jgi:hypothetical protein